MITLRNNYSNLLQFKSNQSAKKRNEDKQPTEHKVRHSLNNKYSTGVITTPDLTNKQDIIKNQQV